MKPGQGFNEYKEDETTPEYTVYDTSSIKIPVRVLAGTDDEYCLAAQNAPFFSTIPDVTVEMALGVANRDFCVDNSI